MFSKGIKNTSNDFYGPFVRTNKKDKWHSSKKCSGYPTIHDVEIKYFSTYPVKTDLCPECIQHEKKNLKLY